MLKVIFSLSPFILSPIVTIHYPLTLLLSSSTINIVTYFKFMKFPILDVILTPSPSPYLLMNPTNHTDHLIVLLKPGTKLNAPLLPPVETPVFIIVTLPLLDDDDPDVSSSSIYHHLTQYMYVFFTKDQLPLPFSGHINALIETVDLVFNVRFTLSQYVCCYNHVISMINLNS